MAHVFVLSFMFLSQLAFTSPPPVPRNPELPPCARFYSRESFAFGLAAGYGVKIGRPDWNDEFCFQQGLLEGKRLAQSYASGRQRCDAAFKDGAEQGFSGEILVIGDPSECSQNGYLYGQSFLSVFARAGRSDLVGEDCVGSYNDGVAAWKANAPAELPNDNRLAACYMTGYYDAPYLR